MLKRIASRMVYCMPTIHLDRVVDLCLGEDGSPVVIGIRLTGYTDYRSPHIEVALIGVLEYGDESKRTMPDIILQ